MSLDQVTWVLTAFSVVGVVLNIKRKREGFIIWMVTNLSWVLVDLIKGIPAQACLFFIYFALSFWGYIEWGKKDTSERAAGSG